jgi:hypothetical protein
MNNEVAPTYDRSGSKAPLTSSHNVVPLYGV